MRNHLLPVSAIILCAILTACAGSGAPAQSAQAPAAEFNDAATRPAADIDPDAPQIPPATFNFSDFGAVGDGKTYNTDAFARAVAAIHNAGGGRLIVGPGTYLTLPITLTSHMDLHLEAGATIQFPADFAAYGLPEPADMKSPDIKKLREENIVVMEEHIPPFVGGEGLSDIAITGPGTIDGAGAIWWSYSDREGRKNHGPWYPRPKLVVFRKCRRILLQDVTLRNSPMYNFAPTQCADVRVENIKTQEPEDSPNTDGVDPTACDRVLIKDCHMDDGDDCVAVKAIGGKCSNILVEGCTCHHGHGISIGSETVGGIENVLVRNCTFDQTKWCIRIKSARDRGNVIRGFTFDHITMTNVWMAIDIDMYYHDNKGAAAHAMKPITPLTPILSDVLISNVTATGTETLSQIVGLPEQPVQGITLQNVQLDGLRGMVIRDAKNITFTHVTITAKEGNALQCENAEMTMNP
jgi:polygalacturonase